MTGGAFGRRLAEGLAARMAGITRSRQVRAAQREVGQLVIELLAAELDNVGIAPVVLGMTGAALRGCDGAKTTVKPTTVTHVARDFLVAIEAQLRLAVAIAAVMARGALLLVLGVLAAELAGHEQGFRVDGHGTFSGQRTHQQCKHEQSVTSSPLHVTGTSVVPVVSRREPRSHELPLQ